MFLSLLVQVGMAGDEGCWRTGKSLVLSGGQLIDTPQWSSASRVQLAAWEGAMLLKWVISCCIILCELCLWARCCCSYCPQETNLRMDFSSSVEILLFQQPTDSHCLLFPCVSWSQNQKHPTLSPNNGAGIFLAWWLRLFSRCAVLRF